MINSKSNPNLGVLGSILVFILGLVFFIVVLLHSDMRPPNVIVSSFCPKTRNSSLCQSTLMLAGSTDALVLANYTLNLAHTNAVEALRYAQQLTTTTTNPQLKKRYLECSRRFDFVVKGIEKGKQALAKDEYIPLSHAIDSVANDADECLNALKKPPPEPSTLPKMTKNLGDTIDIAVSVSSILAKDDY